jgi:hypothetical protein
MGIAIVAGYAVGVVLGFWKAVADVMTGNMKSRPGRRRLARAGDVLNKSPRPR